METRHTSSNLDAPLQQTTNNTTTWLGHRKSDHKEFVTGQTFLATREGDLETIEVFSSVVADPGLVQLTFYSFNSQDQSWGPSMGTASVSFDATCNGKWIAFRIPGLHLNKGMSYGFRLESHDSFVGVGEAAGSAMQPPLVSGKEWHFTNEGKNTNAFSYFSLAFKVALRA